MDMMRTPRPLTAAACVVGAMAMLGLSDNLVILVAGDIGLWQFHFLRSALALPLILIAAVVYGSRLRPVSPAAVALRSFFVSLSMMFYFGALAFLPVAQSAAGLFTAPIWVLLFTRIGLGVRVSALNVSAVIFGFAGVLAVLQPDFGALSPAMAMPVAAGITYAIGAIATRRYCTQETALGLLTGFFLAIIGWSAVGTAVLAVLQPEVPDGTAGFLLRGWVPLTAATWGLLAVQALSAVIGVGLIIRGYLLAEAAYVSVFEYTLLIFGALWGWALWGQVLNMPALAGIALIVLSGVALARSGRSTGS